MSGSTRPTCEEALRSFVADIEAMTLNQPPAGTPACWFGAFQAWENDDDTDGVIIEWPNLGILMAKAKAALAAPEHTPNGYDPAWITAINHALEDRDAGAEISDIDDGIWDKFIGPMLDDIEKEEGGRADL